MTALQGLFGTQEFRRKHAEILQKSVQFHIKNATGKKSLAPNMTVNRALFLLYKIGKENEYVNAIATARHYHFQPLTIPLCTRSSWYIL